MKKIKKLSFAIFLISISTIGCRQQDDEMSDNDKTNLEILQKNSQRNTNQADTISTQTYNLQEGDPIPPPRK